MNETGDGQEEGKVIVVKCHLEPLRHHPAQPGVAAGYLFHPPIQLFDSEDQQLLQPG